MPAERRLKTLDEFTVADLEGIRLLLGGGSVIDWYRLNFRDDEEIRGFVRSLELDLDDPVDRARAEAVKHAAISYLRRHFDFPIPKPVANEDLIGLVRLAGTKGHRQLCACTILKVMHIIHHLEARELLFMLPVSDEEVFHLVEQKVYRIVGSALAAGFPIVEFIGGRKNKDSLYTKLLSKKEVSAANIYDKLRFRIVTKSPDDLFPMLAFLQREVFPFNFAIPGQTTNTLVHFGAYCDTHRHLKKLRGKLQTDPSDVEGGGALDNRFTAPSYRVVHFVVDLPVRLPERIFAEAPPSAWALGRVIFVQAEFQILDRQTDEGNEVGDASHDAYKERQKLAVMRRLQVGHLSRPAPAAPESDEDE
ncbi:MAG: TIGR04552 family protein [Polyangiales bacterium]